MSTDGFLDFGMGVGDDEVGKKSSNFKVKDKTSYRVTFGWFSVRHEDATWHDNEAYAKDGSLTKEAMIRFAGCQRIYKKGVGQILYKGPAYAQFGKPRDCIATILIVWPTDDEGELDIEKFKKGKGWEVQRWLHGDGEKYATIKKLNKRFPLMENDLMISCPENGGEYQKMTFTPEPSNLLMKLLASEKPEAQAIAQKILADVKAVAATIHAEMARDLTIAEILEKAGGESDSPVDSKDHAAKDVDSLLEEMDI